MSMKENWKETGTGLGHAFKNLGKTLINTAAVGVKKAEKWAEDEQNAPQQPSDAQEQSSAAAENEMKENWKETGTELGHAFKNLGKTLINTAAVGVKKAETWAEDEQNAPQQPSAPAENEDKN